MRSAFLAVLVLALVVGGLFFLLGSPASRGRGSAGQEPSSGAAQAEAAQLSNAGAPVDATRTETTRTAESTGERVEAPGAGSTAKSPELDPRRSLEIRVIDTSGTALPGIPVLLAFQEGGTSLQLTNTTGANGLASFENVGRGWPHPIESMTGRTSIAGLFQQPVAQEFAARDWPREPIELVLPPTGSVVVEVRDAAGEPLTPLQGVVLEVEGQRQSGTYLWGPSALQLSVRTEGGVARFECVEPGLSLRAQADCRPDHGTAQASFLGPTRAGEEVHTTLTPQTGGVWIVVRVLSPTGKPLADEAVQVTWGRKMGGGMVSSGAGERRTDLAGTLRVGLREVWSEGVTVTLQLEHSPIDKGSKELWKGTLDLSRSFALGDNSVGDLRLLPEAVLVAGRVVDEEGAPVSSFRAQIQADVSGTGDSWRQVGSATAHTDGSFAAHGNPPTDTLRLAILPDGYVTPDPVPFVPGTDNLEIVVRYGGGLVGTLKPIEGVEFSDLYLSVERDGEDAGGDAEIDADGSFRILGAPSGAVDVVFGTLAIEGDLLTIPAVGVLRGEEKRDPRLQDLDLSPFLRCLRIEVRLAGGIPAQAGWVRPVRRLDRDAPAFLVEGGQARVLTRPEPVDLEVNVPQHRIAVLEGLTQDREVLLEPAFEITLALPDHVPMPAGGTTLEIGLGLLSTDWPRPDSLRLMRGGRQAGWWSGTFGDGGNSFSLERGVRFSVQELGTFDVSFYLISGSPQGGRIAFQVDGTSDLEIGSGDAGRTFVVEPDPGAYEQRLSGR